VLAVNRKIKREWNLEDFEAQAIDSLGGVAGVNLTLRNGDIVTIPHPMLLDDDTQTEVERVQAHRDEDRDEDGAPNGKIGGEDAPPFAIRLAKAILGPEDHARFLAGGGSSNKVGLAWQYMTEGLQQGPKLSKS
jgi:hypothetical protein